MHISFTFEEYSHVDGNYTVLKTETSTEKREATKYNVYV